jgi:hypothetical protein
MEWLSMKRKCPRTLDGEHFPFYIPGVERVVWKYQVYILPSKDNIYD